MILLIWVSRTYIFVSVCFVRIIFSYLINVSFCYPINCNLTNYIFRNRQKQFRPNELRAVQFPRAI